MRSYPDDPPSGSYVRIHNNCPGPVTFGGDGKEYVVQAGQDAYVPGSRGGQYGLVNIAFDSNAGWRRVQIPTNGSTDHDANFTLDQGQVVLSW